MASSEESEEELFDVDWFGIDPAFDYDDPFAMAPQHSAVFQNDIPLLKRLLKSGKSVNINDNNGNTPLHLSVVKDKQKTFDYLLTLDDVRIDAENYDGITPLVLALICQNDYFAFELLKKNADVNIARNTGYTPLHYAITNRSKTLQLLIDRGAEINARNDGGETPLYVACEEGKSDVIYRLLYYGADPLIPSYDSNIPFTASLNRCPFEVQEILFLYTFDKEKVPIPLIMFEKAMRSNSPLFYKIIEKTSELVYEEEDLKNLCEALPRINLQMFGVFIKRFDYAARDMFRTCDCIKKYISFLTFNINEKPKFVEFFYLLCDSIFIDDIVRKYQADGSLALALVARNVPQDVLPKILCCLYSYGIDLHSNDLNCMYRYFGFCDLFKILLHMSIIDCTSHNIDNIFEVFLMPILIYDINLDVDKLLEFPERYIHVDSLPELLKFYNQPKIREFCLKRFPDFEEILLFKKLPTVPSLVELSRNAARKFIIKRYNIKNNVQFFTILKWLPINNFYKAILSLEKEIY